MNITIPEYKGEYRIVSLALRKETMLDLMKNQLDCIYVIEEEIVLLPQNTIISTDYETITQLSQCNDYDVFEIYPNGKLFRYYDTSSIDNGFVLTETCNSNCVMCPTPEGLRKNSSSMKLSSLLELIKHIPSDAQHFTITGGEPFMMGKDIFSFFEALKQKFVYTDMLLLTNGRVFAIDTYITQFLDTVPRQTLVGIPIHGSCSEIHDKITRAPGSFNQTVSGIKRLLENNIRVEIRMVISALNIDDIEDLAQFIISEISQIEHISIIAMEMTGNAFRNRDAVWIPYREAFDRISASILKLIQNGINIKLYNFPLCTVEQKFWTLCEKSISPYKIRFSEDCEKCKMRDSCGGVFAGTIGLEKEELKAII